MAFIKGVAYLPTDKVINFAKINIKCGTGPPAGPRHHGEGSYCVLQVNFILF